MLEAIIMNVISFLILGMFGGIIWLIVKIVRYLNDYPVRTIETKKYFKYFNSFMITTESINCFGKVVDIKSVWSDEVEES